MTDNKEVIKAINKQLGKEKPSKIKDFKKWWNNNSYKVFRVIFFPAWWYVCAKKRINKWLNDKIEWSDERTTEILNYYVPRYSEWNKDEDTFYFFDNGYGWHLTYAKKYLKRKDERYWNKFNWDIKNYLMKSFELDGFVKEVGNCFDGWTEIKFKLNKGDDENEKDTDPIQETI